MLDELILVQLFKRTAEINLVITKLKLRHITSKNVPKIAVYLMGTPSTTIYSLHHCCSVAAVNLICRMHYSNSLRLLRQKKPNPGPLSVRRTREAKASQPPKLSSKTPCPYLEIYHHLFTFNGSKSWNALQNCIVICTHTSRTAGVQESCSPLFSRAVTDGQLDAGPACKAHNPCTNTKKVTSKCPENQLRFFF